MNKGYIRNQKLGEGTYATIYFADEVETLGNSKILEKDEEHVFIKKVALKMIKKTEYAQGMEISAIREIKTLKKINSPYVIEIHDAFLYKDSTCLVIEYIETNLEEIIKNKKIIIMPSDIKAWILMILKGLFACHKKFIVHRDIKPNNILIKMDGTLKIADFGLAREIDGNEMTSNVVTRWYRAPELLMGCKLYTFAVDIWSLGCVFAELFLRTPYFPADNDFSQLETIFKALGTPTDKEWPNMTKLPNYVKYPIYQATPMKNLFTGASEDAINLLEKMLIYDPVKRITVLNALKHNYFINKPRPTKQEKLPFYCDSNITNIQF